MMKPLAAADLRSIQYHDWMGYQLNSSLCAATVLPELGGRIASLVYRPTGREFLVQPNTQTVSAPPEGASFVDSGPFGFDDMCPTILAGKLQLEDGRTVTLPDHGEVWSQPWEVLCSNGALELAIDGRTLPYRLAKRMAFTDVGTLEIEYSLTNRGDFGYDILWAAHPLLHCSDAVKVDITAEEVISTHSGSRLYGDTGKRSSWRPLSLPAGSAGQPPEAHKFYAAEGLHTNVSRVSFPHTGEQIAFRLVAEFPTYFGLWHEERSDGSRTLAPEPCLAGFDRPDHAREWDQFFYLRPFETKMWRLEIEVSGG